MPGECQWLFPEKSFLVVLVPDLHFHHVSGSFCVFSEWEILYGIWGESCSQGRSSQWGPFCGLGKGAFLGRYFKKYVPLQADELELQSVVHEWIEPLCKAKGIPSSGHILSKRSRHELNFAYCVVGQRSKGTTLALFWHGLHLRLQEQFWQLDEVSLRVLCWQWKIIKVLSFATIVIIFFKMSNYRSWKLLFFAWIKNINIFWNQSLCWPTKETF